MKILFENDYYVNVLLNEESNLINNQATAAKEVSVGGSYTEGGYVEGGSAEGEVPPGMPGGAKDPLLSSWAFVIGITLLTLAVSAGLGILLAKKKIKKGIELYED